MGDYTPLTPPELVKLNGTVRGDSVLLTDNWAHEMVGHSAWGPEKSYRGAQLQRLEDGVRNLVGRPTNAVIELRPEDIQAIAALITSALTDNLAEAVANKIAQRMQQ